MNFLFFEFAHAKFIQMISYIFIVEALFFLPDLAWAAPIMDVRPLVSMVWVIFGLLFIIVIVKGMLNSRSFKGWLGEFQVRQVTATQLDAEAYRQFHDVTLPTADGTTQIDHIIVSAYGVFVIETKNFDGWIYGDPNHAKWTQSFGKNKNSFQNPLRQNYKHIKELEALLQIGEEKLFSVVVFTGNAELKTDMPDNVMRIGRLARYVQAKSVPMLTENEVQRILLKINDTMLDCSAETKKQHILNLANKYGPSKPDRQKGELFSLLKMAAIALAALGAISLVNKAARVVVPSQHVKSASINARPQDAISPPVVTRTEPRDQSSAPIAKDEKQKPTRTPRSSEYGFLTLLAKMDTYVTLYDANNVEVVRMEMKKGQEKEIEIRKGYYTAEILQAGKRGVSTVSFLGNTGVLEF